MSSTRDIGAAPDLSALFEIEEDDIERERWRMVQRATQPREEHTDCRTIIIRPGAAGDTVVMGAKHETLRRVLVEADDNIFWLVISEALVGKREGAIDLTKQRQQFFATRRLVSRGEAVEVAHKIHGRPPLVKQAVVPRILLGFPFTAHQRRADTAKAHNCPCRVVKAIGVARSRRTANDCNPSAAFCNV